MGKVIPIFLGLAAGSNAVATLGEEQISEASESNPLFKAPLIVGASVSANFGTDSPGKRLARELGHSNDVLTIARGGTPGKEVLKQISDRELDGRSLVIAVDLLFWDSSLSNCEASIASLDRFLSQLSERKIPIVLGNIPALLPDRQPCRLKLNRHIHDVVKKDPTRVLLDLESLHEDVMKKGYLTIRGQRHPIWDLIPDGLHLSRLASDFLSEQILQGITRAGLFSYRS